ncbi:hypothetical protein [Actinoplanes flavus]|uniref:PH domain-containing protein n=1 Tax=Actinoplanes flavus TaxID=2820290 RepID=A0ABS3UFE3_9ACTN|nr:hypothetical protein [Actinoplanes flavus]MBO3737497.1 hypothetical protein [Actinoplanes flavus]
MSAEKNSSTRPARADTCVLPLNRRRRLQRGLFRFGVALTVPGVIVLVVLAITGAGQLVYLLAPGFLAVLTVPFGIAWIARPNRLPKADPVLDRTGIRLSADGRTLRRDVVLPWDRVKTLTIVFRTLTVDPVAWPDLGGDDEAERGRWAKRERKRQSRPALQYGLAKGLPSREQLRDVVADLSGGRVGLH